jgi:hypothetical protein
MGGARFVEAGSRVLFTRLAKDFSVTSVRFDADMIVHSVAKALLAAEIPLSRLDAHVTEQKLNLFQLATGLMAQARARSALMPHAA